MSNCKKAIVVSPKNSTMIGYSSALLPFKAQLCCFSQLSSAAFHSSALLYLHSTVMLEACKAESWMILQDIYILSLLTCIWLNIDANDYTRGNPDLPTAADCVMLKHW